MSFRSRLLRQTGGNQLMSIQVDAKPMISRDYAAAVGEKCYCAKHLCTEGCWGHLTFPMLYVNSVMCLTPIKVLRFFSARNPMMEIMQSLVVFDPEFEVVCF